MAANTIMSYLSFTCREDLLLITVLPVWLASSSFPDKITGAADWTSVSALEKLPSSLSLKENLFFIFVTKYQYILTSHISDKQISSLP
jgi:hypothetical protein